MTQMIITLENAYYATLIGKVISLMKGVKNISFLNDKETTTITDEPTLDPDLKSIMGIASMLKEIDTTKDERLSYIMSK